MTNDPRTNSTASPQVAPPRLGAAVAARNAARRRISSATLATGILASVGTLGLVGFMGQQAVSTAASSTAASTSAAGTSAPSTSATTGASGISATPTTSATTSTPATSSASSISASAAPAQATTGGS